MLYQTHFEGYRLLGLLGFANDKICLVPNFVNAEQGKKIVETLNVKFLLRITIANSFLIGLFCSGNNKVILLPNIAEKKEVEKIKEKIDVVVLEDVYSCLGNLILMNDYGCIISKYIKGKREFLEKKLEIPVEVSNLPFPGLYGICNNKGCLLFKDIPKEEKEKIEDVLNVNTKVSLYLEDFPKIRVIVNSNGAIIGKGLLPPEIAEICDSLKIKV